MNVGQRWYQIFGAIFFACTVLNTLFLIFFSTIGMITEALLALVMMACSAAMFIHSCWRLNQLKSVETTE